MYVPRGSPSAFLPLWEASLKLASEFIKASFKIPPLSWVWSKWDFCMCPLRAESQFPTVVKLFYLQGLLTFKCRHAGVSFSWYRTPKLGTLMWSSDPSLLGGNLYNCDHPFICGLLTWCCGLGSDCTEFPTILPTLLWFLLYIFSCVNLLCWYSCYSHW